MQHTKDFTAEGLLLSFWLVFFGQNQGWWCCAV